MKLSRKLNIVISQAIIIVAVVAVFILVPIQKDRVATVNKKLIALMQVFISQDNTTIANAIFENRSRAIDIRLRRIIKLDDVTNAVVFNSDFHLLSTSPPSLPVEDFIPQFKIAIEQHFSSWTTANTLWYLQSIDLFDETIGFVLIEYSLTDMNRREYMNIVVLTLILFAIMSIFLLVLNRMIKNRVLLPVNSLIENMTSIEDGHYGGQIDICSDDEIGDLAYKYNAMSSQIMQTHNRVLSIGNMLENIIDSMPSVLFSVNGETVVVAWNAAAEKFTDLSRKEAVGRCYADLFSMLVPYQHVIKTVIETKQPESVREIEVANHYYDISIYPLMSPDSKGAVIRLDDVTESKINEEQLYQSQKMETIGVLAGGLAHDFNNVLAGIIGTTSILKHKLGRGEIAREQLELYINTIETSSDRAVGMVRQLLTISKKYEPTMAHMDLNIALANVIAVCRNTFDKKIVIAAQLYPGEAYVVGDTHQLEQILLNICVNAAHAMTIMRKNDLWGGTLSIIIVKKKIVYQDTLFDKIEHKNLFEITITDTGVGIEKNNLKSIFDPFFSTKPHDSGTGLGLSMVFRTINKHNGFIDVQSVINGGTTFKVYLPVLEDVVPDDTVALDELEIQKEDNHILIVDDEQVVRETARDMLEICGYDVTLASSGIKGLEALGTVTRPVDLVLLDMAMPEMSGKETFVKIRESYPNIKVLLTSGNSSDERVVEAIEIGVDGFIAKPFQMKVLVEKVRKILST